MKTWIIILAIVFVVLKLTQIALRNYIRNDKWESAKYYYHSGNTTLGALHGLFWLLSTLVGCADAILLFIYLINMI